MSELLLGYAGLIGVDWSWGAKSSCKGVIGDALLPKVLLGDERVIELEVALPSICGICA